LRGVVKGKGGAERGADLLTREWRCPLLEVRDAVRFREQHVHGQRHTELTGRFAQPLAHQSCESLELFTGTARIEQVGADAHHGRAWRRCGTTEGCGKAWRAQGAHEPPPPIRVGEHGRTRFDEDGVSHDPEVRTRGSGRGTSARSRGIAREQLRVRSGLRDDGGLAAAGRAEHEDDGLRGERAARKPRARRGDGGKGIVTTGRGGSVDRLVDRTQEPEQGAGGHETQHHETDAERDTFALGEREHPAEEPGEEHERQKHGEGGVPARRFAASHGR